MFVPLNAPCFVCCSRLPSVPLVNSWFALWKNVAENAIGHTYTILSSRKYTHLVHNDLSSLPFFSFANSNSDASNFVGLICSALLSINVYPLIASNWSKTLPSNFVHTKSVSSVCLPCQNCHIHKGKSESIAASREKRRNIPCIINEFVDASKNRNKTMKRTSKLPNGSGNENRKRRKKKRHSGTLPKTNQLTNILCIYIKRIITLCHSE